MGSAWAQDSVLLKNGQRREGAIQGVSGGLVSIQFGSGAKGTVALADVESVVMEPPADLAAAEKDIADGNHQAAATKLQKLVDTYSGLPAAWIPRATLMLADSLINIGNVDGAEKALVAYRQAFPEGSDAISLLQAKVAVARNNTIGAKPLLAPILEKANQSRLADSEDSVLYGQAFFLMGQIHEADSDYSNALEAYLKSSTIFFEDSSTAAKAQERADFLVAEKGAVVP